MKLKKNQGIYFRKSVQELVENKIDLHFSRTKKVDDCGGYFCPETKSLRVAIWNKDWFSIFIHEYNHFKQWYEQTDLWKSVEAVDFFNDFPDKYSLPTQLMEQECDKMVYRDIVRFELEGMDNYICESNAYHVSYVNMVDEKKFPSLAPFRFKDILNLCPEDRFFETSELKKPSKELYDLISEKCF